MKAIFKNFEISTKFVGKKSSDWLSNQNTHHKVTVKNEFGSITFDYWASQSSPKIETKEHVLYAFDTILNDISCGLLSFKDFCSEFGYDDDSRKSERVWKACKKYADKFKKMNDADIYDLQNELQEEINKL